MPSHVARFTRIQILQTIVLVALAVLGLKVLLSIVIEYRRYFPADFASSFLTGRQESFTTTYATAFYIHILSGPPTILLGTLLLVTGGRPAIRTWHRWAGRAQAILIFAALVPSSLVMAPQALSGPVAAVGFAALAVATGYCTALAVYMACAGRFKTHKRWASRTFILLISPLLLRLVSGVLIVTDAESALAYSLNAWLSWLVPLVIYETWWRCTAVGKLSVSSQPAGLSPEGLP